MLIATPGTRSARVTLSLTCVAAAVLWGCSGGTGRGTAPPTPPASLSITTQSLPDGKLNVPYSATLAATGGTLPYTWSLNNGSLPTGLTLNSTSGLVSGVPTATAAAMALTFTVTDAANSAQTNSANLTLTIAKGMSITTTSLPNGQVGSAYATTLSASGGTAPVSWALSGGTLPAGLMLNATTGTISGTPTATAAQTPLTFTATDSSSMAQTTSDTLTLTIGPAGIAVAISPARAGLTVTQNLTISAATNDNAGVSWSVSPAGGSFNPSASLNGANVTFTAAAAAGVYTLTATSVTDTSRSASITVGVTDLPGVYTYHNDAARDGANTREFALTPANVNTASFGKLFACTVDGAVYAQPLWVANLSVGGAVHNVVFVATQHDSLYAFDADTSPCTQLWKANLIDAAHGASSGETTVPAAAGPTGFLVGGGAFDIAPEVGVTGTPVIDPATGILYVVSKSVNVSGPTFYQRLHAIDLTSGNELSGSPVTIGGTFNSQTHGTIPFSSQLQNQRAGLALIGNTVYIAWGSHEDRAPWYGWMMGYTYNAAATPAFTRSAILNVTPDDSAGGGGIWMGAGAPAVDSLGSLYVTTGNGNFDVSSAPGMPNPAMPNDDYADSFLQLSGALGITWSFTPSNQAQDNTGDEDFGAGGAAVVLNLPIGSPRRLLLGGGKDGYLYLLDGDLPGGYGDSIALERFSVGNPIFATSAFWNNTVYIAPVGGSLLAFGFNPLTNLVNTAAASQSPTPYGFPGSTPSVSASGASGNGIVWGLDTGNYCTPGATNCGPAVLHAYNATNLASELWNGTQDGADAAGNAVKFTVPTVANGKVYVGTRGSNTGGAFGSGGTYGELDVYGLKPN